MATLKLNFTAVVLFLFIFTSNSFSSARLLNDFLSNGLAATEPTLNLALPVHDESEQDPKPRVLPCDHMVRIKNSHPRLAGKYGPMILSMLPKGDIPSSGPSKGTNQVKN